MSPLGSLRHAISAHHLEHEARDVALFLALGGALALGAAVGVAWAAGFGHVAHRLRHPHVIWLLLALVGAAATHIGYVLAYREIAHVDEGVRIHPLRAGALVTTGWGIFFPRGGFALDLEALRDLGVPPREARVRVLGLGSLEYAVLATGACVSAYVLLARHAHAQQAVLLSWTIGVPVGTGLALLAAHWRDAICRGPLAGPLRPALEGIDVVGKILVRPRQHGVAAFLGMAIYWAGEVFVLWACLSAFTDRTPSIPAVVVGYATGYALTRRTLPLAGAGAVEALLPFALGWVGFPLASAVLAVVAYRVVNVWLPVGPALAAMIALRRRRVAGSGSG